MRRPVRVMSDRQEKEGGGAHAESAGKRDAKECGTAGKGRVHREQVLPQI